MLHFHWGRENYYQNATAESSTANSNGLVGQSRNSHACSWDSPHTEEYHRTKTFHHTRGEQSWPGSCYSKHTSGQRYRCIPAPGNSKKQMWSNKKPSHNSWRCLKLKNGFSRFYSNLALQQLFSPGSEMYSFIPYSEVTIMLLTEMQAT